MARRASLGELCMGCAACVHVCPQNCITIAESTSGYYEQRITADRCIDCMRCLSVCPAWPAAITTASPDSAAELNLRDRSADGIGVSAGEEQKSGMLHRPQKVLAVKHMDPKILAQSTSGGAMLLLAEDIISRGGIVLGVKPDENWRLKYAAAESMAEAAEFCGAKYLQADAASCYDLFLPILAQTPGRPVMVVGTPCMIAGLRKFLATWDANRADLIWQHSSESAGLQRETYGFPNLLLVDFVCNGVPSPAAFRSYMKKLERRGKVSDFCFRDKTGGGWHHSRISYRQNGQTQYEELADNAFTNAYFADSAVHTACFSCPYASMKRAGDVTLGDFWGIERISPEFDDPRGVSVVCLNTERGLAEENWIKSHSRWEEHSIDSLVQPRFHSPVPRKNQGWWSRGLKRLLRKTLNRFRNR